MKRNTRATPPRGSRRPNPHRSRSAKTTAAINHEIDSLKKVPRNRSNTHHQPKSSHHPTDIQNNTAKDISTDNQKDSSEISDDELDVEIGEETTLDELPDVSETCASATFLNRPFDVAFQKPSFTTIETTSTSIISTTTPLLSYQTALETIPIEFRKEFSMLLKANDVAVDHIGELLFSAMRGYSDVMYVQRVSDDQLTLLRLLVALHVATHIREIRTLRVRHTLETSPDTPPPADTGFVRPTVLAIFPMKTAALLFIRTLLLIFGPTYSSTLRNEARLAQEFPDLPQERGAKKPAEFFQIFEGNNQDSFKVGIKFGAAGVAFYANYFDADLIVASPLGVRLLLERETAAAADVFASIKLLVVEQFDVMEMQNVDHLHTLLERINHLPNRQHGVDIRRIYPHELDGKAAHYRQTIVFSRYPSITLNGIMRRCLNATVFRVLPNTSRGCLDSIIRSLPLTFHRIPTSTPLKAPTERFAFFTTTFLPSFADGLKTGVLVVVPSYFDFLRIRQRFVDENESFVCMGDYSPANEVITARSKFRQEQVDYLLLSERFHFYHRNRIPGIKHVVFYALPSAPHYAPEIINMIKATVADASVHFLFTAMEVMTLRAIVGDERAAFLLQSAADKNVVVAHH